MTMAIACFVAMACHVASVVIIDVAVHEAMSVACFVAVTCHLASAVVVAVASKKSNDYWGTPTKDKLLDLELGVLWVLQSFCAEPSPEKVQQFLRHTNK